MKEFAKGLLYICDDPDCETRTFVDENDLPPDGLHFNNVLHVFGGGDTFDFYSCKTDTEHVMKAFQNAWKRYQEGEFR